MKIRKHIFRIAALSTVFAVGIGATVYHNATRKEADAYSATSLPTTIDLNDYTEQEIRSYYSSLNSLSTSERQGTNLLKNLKTILKNGQKYLNYDSGDSVWNIYEITDRDWERSPASSISHGTYNPTTNKITNYTYGSNGDNPYLHALYVNRNVNHQTRAWGDHSQNNWGINREHIWAKSQGFQDKGQGGARGDPMHLWAANGHVNNIHSNYFFGFVDKTTSYTDCGEYRSYLSYNYRGDALNSTNSSCDVFEPQDCDKGDIARAVFYMAARYNYYSGSDSDGINSNNPNLKLTNNLSDWRSSGVTSSASNAIGMGLLSDLLAWNKLDPVDEYEIHRNNLLHRNYTNNRNPFIDFPEWADAIWGTANIDGTNYNPTITTYASPSSDPIGSSTVTPTFGISYESLNLQVNETAVISARNAETTINWSVEDDTVVSLNKTSTSNNDNVTITALTTGTTTITATSGGDSATCTVTVTQPSNGEFTKIASYDFSEGNTSTSPAYDDDGLLTRFHNSSSNSLSDIVIDVNDTNRVYPAFNSSYLHYGIKLGASGVPGTFTVSLNTNVTKVVVDVAGWEATDSLKVGDAEPQTPGVAYNSSNCFKTLSYEITSSNEIEFIFNNRGFIRSIDFYSNETPEITPRNYLTNVNRFAGLYGNESTSGTTAHSPETITFADLGLNNAEQYSDPFDGGEFTVTFGGGSNDGRYYDTGLGIRTYGNGTITIASTLTMAQINFVWDNSSSYRPSDGSVANVGTYDASTYVWTGSATSVTLTRPSGTGHWRLRGVTVTYSGASISVTGMYFKFSLSIPQDDWDAIADNWEISDYGFMIVKENTLVNTYKEETVEDAYFHNKRLQNLHKQDGETPFTDESNYLFSVILNIGDNIAHNLRFCASPYIVVDDVYYFLGEIRCNINQLADTCLTSGRSNLSEDALTYLKTH